MTKDEFLSYIINCDEESFNYKKLLDNLKDTDVNVDEDVDFVIEFQNSVLTRNSQTPSKAFLTDYKVQFRDSELVARDNKDVRDISKWTIRHYSDKKFDTIFSKMSLEKKGASTKGNTAHKDWLVLGNTGNTFFILCYDGTPLVKKGFLNNSNFYFEMELSSVSTKIWISEDLLSLSNEKPIILGGNNGTSLFNQILGLKDLKKPSGDCFIKSLCSAFNNSIEVKIPSAVNTSLGKWHEIIK